MSNHDLPVFMFALFAVALLVMALWTQKETDKWLDCMKQRPVAECHWGDVPQQTP